MKIYTTIENKQQNRKKNQHKKKLNTINENEKQFMGIIYFQRKIILFKRSLLFS